MNHILHGRSESNVGIVDANVSYPSGAPSCILCRRSILPENLHFDKDLNIKLTHFASALDLGAGPVPESPESFSVVDYLAPEV